MYGELFHAPYERDVELLWNETLKHSFSFQILEKIVFFIFLLLFFSNVDFLRLKILKLIWVVLALLLNSKSQRQTRHGF